MDFPAFEHASWLARAWADGAPPHDLGVSGFRSPVVAGLLNGAQASDVDSMDLHAGTTLRDALATRHGVAPAQVRVTAGTSAANTAAVMAAVSGGNAVAEAPTYMPLPHLATGLGAEIRYGALEELPDLCDDKTQAILVTSPNNPTGRVISADEFKRLGDAASDHGAVVIADQVYRELSDHPIGADHPSIITTAGMNKCWGAPGLRIGWAIASPEWAARIEETHRILALAPPAFGTRMALHLLDHEAACRHALEAHTDAAHRIFQAHADAAGWHATRGRLTAVLHTREPSLAMASGLLEKGILTVPLELFGASHGLRIGFGGDLDALDVALGTLQRQQPKGFDSKPPSKRA